MSSGQPIFGGKPRPDGAAIRIAATSASSRRSTTALVNCVVPSMTASTEASIPGRSESMSSSAFRMPVSTSAEVSAFVEATTESPSSRTASVCVPPTSIPILSMSLLLWRHQ